jgi:hypothetical protein
MRKTHILIIVFLSLVLPSIMTYIGLSHNAMMEFCKNDHGLGGECVIDIGLVISLFSMWYIFSFAVISILFYLIKFVITNINN